MAPGLSCPVACGIFPDQRWNLCPLHWQADSYPLDHQGSLPIFVFNVVCLLVILVQAVSPLALLTFVLEVLCWGQGGGWAAHCGHSIPDLHPLEASSTPPPSRDHPDVSRHSQMSPGGSRFTPVDSYLTPSRQPLAMITEFLQV